MDETQSEEILHGRQYVRRDPRGRHGSSAHRTLDAGCPRSSGPPAFGRVFEPDQTLPWRMQAGRGLRVGEVLVHHDAAPYNGRHGGGLTVIDWDFCGPGDPIENLAFSAWRWIPLWADKSAVADGHGGALTAAAAGAKLAALADGYAASPDQARICWTHASTR